MSLTYGTLHPFNPEWWLTWRPPANQLWGGRRIGGGPSGEACPTEGGRVLAHNTRLPGGLNAGRLVGIKLNAPVTAVKNQSLVNRSLRYLL